MKKLIFLISVHLLILFVCRVGAVELIPPKKVIKVVPTEICVVNDGVNKDTDAKDDGRFNPFKRFFALLNKNLIWSKANIVFKPQSLVFIDDPDTSIGQPGEVVYDETLSSQDRETTKVRKKCNEKIGEDVATVKMVEILARRIIETNGQVGSLGLTAMPECCKRQVLNNKPIVNDPDTFDALLWPPHPLPLHHDNTGRGVGIHSSFVRTLAHENGHALCLKHPSVRGEPSGQPASRLMSQTGRTESTGISDEEKKLARAEAQKLNGTIPKDKTGTRLPENRPRSRASFDTSGDVAVSWVDISEAFAVTRADRNLGLELELSGLIPDDIAGLRYVFMVDVDNNPATGGIPVVGFSHSFSGAELVVDVGVSKTAGQPMVSSTVKAYVSGQFLPVTDPRITSSIVTVSESLDSMTAVDQEETPIFDVISFMLPADLLPTGLREGYRVASFALDSNAAALDEAPIVDGSITEYPEPTFIKLSPLSGKSGDVITVNGQEFNPNSTVDIYLSTQLVASVATDSSGAFTAMFTVPGYNNDTFDGMFVFNSELAGYVSPVTAIDRTEEMIGERTVLKSDAFLLLLSGLPPSPRVCDINGDGKVDISDINAIFAARNTKVSTSDPRDVNQDGVITVEDARICSLQCTKSKCAP